MRPALQASKQEALDWEHRFLSQFDYAWNRRCNAEARHVALRQVKSRLAPSRLTFPLAALPPRTLTELTGGPRRSAAAAAPV